MKNIVVICIFILRIDGHALLGQEVKPFQLPSDISLRKANILSEGTRMAAEVFASKDAKGKLPTIVMSHGWGGVAAAWRSDAVVFARAGFLVIIFDYRGWGDSDSRLILANGKLENKDGKLIAEVIEVRGVVDPIDQTTDIMNAVHWVQSEELCDKNRIGLWGSSFSGGHVVYVAARDPRVKAIVNQVGALHARWSMNDPALRAHVDRCHDCAKLFIIAENEELFDNKDHAIAAYDRATGVKELVVVKNIKHYGIYREKREEAQQLAIDWFKEHL